MGRLLRYGRGPTCPGRPTGWGAVSDGAVYGVGCRTGKDPGMGRPARGVRMRRTTRKAGRAPGFGGVGAVFWAGFGLAMEGPVLRGRGPSGKCDCCGPTVCQAACRPAKYRPRAEQMWRGVAPSPSGRGWKGPRESVTRPYSHKAAYSASGVGRSRGLSGAPELGERVPGGRSLEASATASAQSSSCSCTAFMVSRMSMRQGAGDSPVPDPSRAPRRHTLGHGWAANRKEIDP